MNITNNGRLAYLKRFEKKYDAGEITLDEYLYILNAELDNLPKEPISA